MKKLTKKFIINNKRVIDLKYHQRQYDKPYETTTQIFDFLNKKFALKNKTILDLGCGAGANIYYAKKNFKTSDAIGIDLNSILIRNAKKIMDKKKIKDVEFYLDDIENYKKVKKRISAKIDVVTILQVLSVLDDYKKVLSSAINLKPNYIIVSSLFWDGYLDIKIKVNFLKKNKSGYKKSSIYNIYSIYKYLEFMKSKGYKKNYIKKLKIKNLKFKNKKIMGSYTANLNGKKVLLTGPLLQDWYFILSKR
tara:strand:+ start:2355 stop:3104 length:750 start_codon:yes stop_codon:yes gene_type:complete